MIKTNVTKSITVKIFKRSMMSRSAANTITNIVCDTTSNFAKRSVSRFGFKFNSPQAIQSASDNNGFHKQEVTFVCAEPDCSQKQCDQPCDTVVSAIVERHFSHKIPPNRTGEFLNSTDINRNQKDQFSVNSNNPNKKISSSDLKELTEHDMQPCPKTNDFINNFLK